MKPKVDDKRCFASQNVCKALKACPMKAISYIEVAEPILDKNLVCNCSPQKTIALPYKFEPLDALSNSCGCDCVSGECGNDLYSCGGTPYGRIIIDYEKCIECGICADECCGTAIDMI